MKLWGETAAGGEVTLVVVIVAGGGTVASRPGRTRRRPYTCGWLRLRWTGESARPHTVRLHTVRPGGGLGFGGFAGLGLAGQDSGAFCLVLPEVAVVGFEGFVRDRRHGGGVRTARKRLCVGLSAAGQNATEPIGRHIQLTAYSGLLVKSQRMHQEYLSMRYRDVTSTIQR